MARKLTERDKQRGERVKAIRDGLGLTQYEFADQLNDAAERLGLPADYRYYTVSRLESGSVGFEDAAVCLSLDSERKNGELRWDWFVFGERRVGRLKPRPGGAAADDRKRA